MANEKQRANLLSKLGTLDKAATKPLVPEESVPAIKPVSVKADPQPEKKQRKPRAKKEAQESDQLTLHNEPAAQMRIVISKDSMDKVDEICGLIKGGKAGLIRTAIDEYLDTHYEDFLKILEATGQKPKKK